MQVGNRFFRCWHKGGHGRTSIVDAIKVSCDVYFYDLSMKLKLDDFRSYVQQNMLAVRTEIDLPNERTGFFPDTAWYKKKIGRYASITGHKVNLAIGQGEVLLTPLQVCAYYAAIANDGLWNQPHLVEKTVGRRTIPLRQFNDIQQVKLPLSAENLKILQQGLYSVCNVPGGTANNVRVSGATTYGKTGSAENVFGKITHAWFSGYIVTDKPEIVVTVFLENAGHGGSVAAPLAARILNYYMGNIQTIRAPAVVPPQFQAAEDDFSAGIMPGDRSPQISPEQVEGTND